MQMKKLVVFAASVALATGGLAGSASAIGCMSGAVAGGVAGHFVKTNGHRHTLSGMAVGCVAGHMAKEHEKKVARQRAAAAAAGQPIHH
jgi:hypothetical protein